MIWIGGIRIWGNPHIFELFSSKTNGSIFKMLVVEGQNDSNFRILRETSWWITVSAKGGNGERKLSWFSCVVCICVCKTGSMVLMKELGSLFDCTGKLWCHFLEGRQRKHRDLPRSTVRWAFPSKDGPIPYCGTIFHPRRLPFWAFNSEAPALHGARWCQYHWAEVWSSVTKGSWCNAGMRWNAPPKSTMEVTTRWWQTFPTESQTQVVARDCQQICWEFFLFWLWRLWVIQCTSISPFCWAITSRPYIMFGKILYLQGLQGILKMNMNKRFQS